MFDTAKRLVNTVGEFTEKYDDLIAEGTKKAGKFLGAKFGKWLFKEVNDDDSDADNDFVAGFEEGYYEAKAEYNKPAEAQG